MSRRMIFSITLLVIFVPFISSGCNLPQRTVAPTAVKEDELVGTVSRITDVVQHGPSAARLATVQGTNPLNPGDVLKVSQGGEGLLDFGNFLQVRMFNNTQLRAITFTRGENLPLIARIQLESGGFTGQLVPEGGQAVFETPDGAEITILGTQFWVVYDAAEEVLGVGNFDGHIAVETQGASMSISPDHYVLIESGQPPEVEMPMTGTRAEIEESFRREGSPVNALRSAMNIPTLTPTPVPTISRPSDSQGEPGGKIVFTCIIGDFAQVCLLDPTTGEIQQVTHGDQAGSVYPSLAPDGNSILFTSNKSGDHAIYELDLASGREWQITQPGGDKAYPVLSPDGQLIAYAETIEGTEVIFLIPHDVSDADRWELYKGGNRPAWSPDGRQIAFICAVPENQICIINADGSGLYQVTKLENVNVKVSWAPDGNWLVFSVGDAKSGRRKLCLIRPDGRDYTEIYTEGDAVTPSFSPDGNWIAFTGYVPGGQDRNGEIYIIRPDGADLRRLSENDRLDSQPFWGR